MIRLALFLTIAFCGNWGFAQVDTYIERPGRHDWNYWQQALPYHVLFFSEFFKTEP